MLNRTSIEEANRHLQALYGRISELEAIAQEQHDALLAKDSFIQIKIHELSHQDVIIQDLRNQLQERDKLLSVKNKEIEQLNDHLEAKNKELSILKQRNEALNDFMKLSTDLKSVMTKLDTVVEYVNDIQSNSYEDTTESPIDGGYISAVHSHLDNGLENDHNINPPDARFYDVGNSSNVKNVSSKNCIPGSGHGVINNVKDIQADQSSPTHEMNVEHSSEVVAQQFLLSGVASKFSVSEDSNNGEKNVGVNSSGQKEVYF